ncbi:DUF948 domain-containing protein [Microbacterium sp. STN6]|uniref:DUF948 domain-containing protein n=1 Tax=Microbacterium sp. STN6 TaxID=2995588 RepID=UPI002260E1CB|nr:DUF948 domain-containing protein [Microbacterium sp. STN6]MCX7521708.1 DUF948 domain-containing protein [Microbacterium sp. STN6]
MSVSDIAGLVAALVFAVLVGLLAVPLLKLGRVLDETRAAIREASDGLAPILEETAGTIRDADAQLKRVDTITGHVEEVTGNVSALVALVAATVGGPLIKLAGFSAGVRAAFKAAGAAGKRPAGSKRSRDGSH